MQTCAVICVDRHVAVAGPVEVGVEVDGLRARFARRHGGPSSNDVVATKAPPVGGLDFVMVTLVRTRVGNGERPTGGLAYFDGAVVVVFAGDGQNPGSAGASGQRDALVPSRRFHGYFAGEGPVVVGSKVMLTVSQSSPAAIVVPAAATPVAPNGADGSLTALIVSAEPPTLRNVADAEPLPPTIVPPNESTGGRRFELELRPSGRCPDSEKVTLPALVSDGERRRLTSPVRVGVKVTGTCDRLPGASWTGSAGEGIPSVNCG